MVVRPANWISRKAQQRLFIALLLTLCVPCVWARKHHYSYQKGVLVSFTTKTTGQDCDNSANTTGSVDDSGNVNASTDGSSSCQDVRRVFYTIKVDGHTYVITPDKYVLPGIYGAIFNKPSVLYSQFPGTPILVRSYKSDFYVKVGKRESRYSVVEAK